MNTELEALDATAADIAQKEAQLRAAQAAAAADETKLIEALGIATADNDHKATTLLEKQLGDARNALQRIVAGLGVLGQRKAATEAQRRAAALADANAQLARLESAARDELVAALAITDQWLAQFAVLQAITQDAELLAATWRNELVPAPHFASAVGGAPPWLGEFRRWRNDWAGELDRWLATAPQ